VRSQAQEKKLKAESSKPGKLHKPNELNKPNEPNKPHYPSSSPQHRFFLLIHAYLVYTQGHETVSIYRAA